MKRDENLIILRGTLGKDPETRTLPSQALVANFSLATDETHIDRATKQPVKRTTWHRIVAYGALAELCQQQLRRGMRAYIKGSVNTRSRSDTKTGQKSQIVEVIAQDIEPLGLSSSRAQQERGQDAGRAGRQSDNSNPQRTRRSGARQDDRPPTFNPYDPGDEPPFDDYPDDYHQPN